MLLAEGLVAASLPLPPRLLRERNYCGAVATGSKRYDVRPTTTTASGLCSVLEWRDKNELTVTEFKYEISKNKCQINKFFVDLVYFYCISVYSVLSLLETITVHLHIIHHLPPLPSYLPTQRTVGWTVRSPAKPSTKERTIKKSVSISHIFRTCVAVLNRNVELLCKYSDWLLVAELDWPKYEDKL